jgi:hypothetical protein
MNCWHKKNPFLKYIAKLKFTYCLLKHTHLHVKEMFSKLYERLESSTATHIEGHTFDVPKLFNMHNDPIDNLEKLIPLCETAPIGYGTQTVFDTQQRNNLQSKPNTIKVHWNGLERAIQKCNENLLRDSDFEIRPEFHKVLVYNPGNFFTWHRDHKDRDNLFATLSVVVDLGTDYKGGIVEFSNPDDPIADIQKVASWDSSRKESNWAAWISSQYHRVTAIDNGVRVAVTYKLYSFEKENSETKKGKYLQSMHDHQIKI